MRQRLEEIGGQCRIESRPGVGTKINFNVHWPEQ
jgi:signal transduction histidine kinase